MVGSTVFPNPAAWRTFAVRHAGLKEKMNTISKAVALRHWYTGLLITA
jgi:hypothetical protein